MDKFFSVLHSVGSIAAVLFYMQMADRYDFICTLLITCTKFLLGIHVCRLDYFTRVSVGSQFVLHGAILLALIVLTVFTIKDIGKVMQAFSICSIFIVVVFFSLLKAEIDILSYDQCKEWRGWMMIILVLVHYSGLDKVIYVRIASFV